MVALNPSVQTSKIQDWFPELNPETLRKISLFKTEVINYNDALGLVSPKSLQFIDVLHFSDSIKGARLIFENANPSRILDIGSGGGFPGLVFAILYPKVKVTLAESDGRKSDFLKKMIRSLELVNVDVYTGPVEKMPDNSFEFAMSRGISTIPKLGMSLRRLIKKGGGLYFFKGDEWAREVADMPIQLCSYWSPALVGDYLLPVGGVKLSIVRLTKMTD